MSWLPALEASTSLKEEREKTDPPYDVFSQSLGLPVMLDQQRAPFDRERVGYRL